MKTVGYLRVSTGSQDLGNQKLAILDYARQKHFAIDRFIEVRASSRKNRGQRKIEELLASLTAGDRLVVSELSRLGRSLGQVIQIVEELVRQKTHFVAIKEGIRFEGKQDLQTKVMIALFGLFAEVERDLISERTKEGLAAARAKGQILGRPKGALGQSKLDGKEDEIRMLLKKEVSKTSIAKIVGISRAALYHFIATRKLDPKASSSAHGFVILRAYFYSNLGGTLISPLISGVVSATEVASYVYCPEQWRLQHGLGHSSTNTASLARGTALHRRTAAVEVWSRRALRLGFVLVVLAALLVLRAFFLRR